MYLSTEWVDTNAMIMSPSLHVPGLICGQAVSLVPQLLAGVPERGQGGGQGAQEPGAEEGGGRRGAEILRLAVHLQHPAAGYQGERGEGQQGEPAPAGQGYYR